MSKMTGSRLKLRPRMGMGHPLDQKCLCIAHMEGQ